MSTYTIMRETYRALVDALYLRADGSRHQKDCFNRSVNSRMYPCSPSCIETRKALIACEQWLRTNQPGVPAMVVPVKKPSAV